MPGLSRLNSQHCRKISEIADRSKYKNWERARCVIRAGCLGHHGHPRSIALTRCAQRQLLLPLPCVGEKRLLDLRPDSASKHHARLSKLRRLRKQKREREEERLRATQAEREWHDDSMDKWPVQACLGVRLHGPRRCVEVLVRWVGDWKDSWERASNLSRDLAAAARAEAAWRFPALQRKLEAREVRSVGVRKRRLRALEAAREVQATGRTWRLRREGGLLSWNVAAAHVAFSREWARDTKRARRVLLDSDEDSGGGACGGGQQAAASSSQVIREGESPCDGRRRMILDGSEQPAAEERRGGRVRRLVRMYELRGRAARSAHGEGRDA